MKGRYLQEMNRLHNKKRNEKISSIIFIVIIMGFLLMGVLGQFMIQDSLLQGEQNEVVAPQMEIKKVFYGEWQNEYENYVNNNIKIRNVLIPIRNQIMYSLFHTSPNSNIVLGKNNSIYEEKYVAVETQLYTTMREENIVSLVEKLQIIKEQLEKKGKYLFVYITPSKANIYPEDMPEKYVKFAPQERKVCNYKMFINQLDTTDIAYYDSVPTVVEMKKMGDYDVFPKTGTHWSGLTGALCGIELADSMEEQLGINLPEMSISYEMVDTPPASEDDIFSTLNLISQPDAQYEKAIYTVEDDDKDDITVLVRGGSFLGMSFNGPLIYNNYFSHSYYLENVIFRDSEESAATTFNEYVDLDIKEMVNDSDIIVLEVNQNCIDMMSFGFIDFLLEGDILE